MVSLRFVASLQMSMIEAELVFITFAYKATCTQVFNTTYFLNGLICQNFFVTIYAHLVKSSIENIDYKSKSSKSKEETFTKKLVVAAEISTIAMPNDSKMRKSDAPHEAVHEAIYEAIYETVHEVAHVDSYIKFLISSTSS